MKFAVIVVHILAILLGKTDTKRIRGIYFIEQNTDVIFLKSLTVYDIQTNVHSKGTLDNEENSNIFNINKCIFSCIKQSLL